jgi:outer membrane protein assembly factor BamB
MLYRRWGTQEAGSRSLLAVVTGNRLLMRTDAGYLLRRLANGMQVWRSHDRLPPSLDAKAAPSLQGAPVHHRFTWAVGHSYLVDAENRLCAYDDSTGQRRWSYPTAANGKEPPTSRALAQILGTPIVQGSNVFLAAVDGDHRLTVHRLRRQTGEPIEILELARLERVDQPGLVVEAEGTLLLLSNSGVMAAIDAASGEPRWLRTYPSREMSVAALDDSTGQAPALARPLMSMAVGGGHFIVLPSDSDTVWCLDAATGELAWSQPRRSAAEYVVGCDRRWALLVSGDVRSLAIGTGEELWQQPATVPAAGHGVVVGDSILLPHTEGVLMIPVIGGSGTRLVPSGTPRPRLPYDIWCVEDYLLAVEATRLTVFRIRSGS